MLCGSFLLYAEFVAWIHDAVIDLHVVEGDVSWQGIAGPPAKQEVSAGLGAVGAASRKFTLDQSRVGEYLLPVDECGRGVRAEAQEKREDLALRDHAVAASAPDVPLMLSEAQSSIQGTGDKRVVHLVRRHVEYGMGRHAMQFQLQQDGVGTPRLLRQRVRDRNGDGRVLGNRHAAVAAFIRPLSLVQPLYALVLAQAHERILPDLGLERLRLVVE